MPSLRSCPAGPGGFSNTAMSPNSFRYVDWTKHGRGMSAIIAPQCAPGAPPMPYANAVEDTQKDPAPGQSPTKPSLLKKIKSQLRIEVPNASIRTDENDPHGYGYTTAAPVDQSGSYILKPTSCFKGEDSFEGYDEPRTGDPLLDGACQETPAKFKPFGTALSNGGSSDRYNDSPNSLTKSGKQNQNIRTGASFREVEERTRELDEATVEEAQATSTFAPSTSSTPAPNLSQGGHLSGTEDSGWNDAVKWAKHCLKERGQRETANELSDPEVGRLRKLKNLRAGKDIVRHLSRLGLTPKKPVEEITEDEFEVVGSAATTPRKETSGVEKRTILGAFFSRMFGTEQEQENEAEGISRQLDTHASLQVLTLPAIKCGNGPKTEDQSHYDLALRLLHGEGYEEENLASPFISEGSYGTTASTPNLERERTLDALEGKDTLHLNSDRVGLGITNADGQQQLEAHNRALAKTKYEEFTALKHRQLKEAKAVEDVDEHSVESDVADAFRPMSTIEEADYECSDGGLRMSTGGLSGFECTDSTKSMTFDDYNAYVNRPDNPLLAAIDRDSSRWSVSTNLLLKRLTVQRTEDRRADSTLSTDSANEVREMETFQGLSGPYQPRMHNFEDAVDRYLDIEGDASSTCSQDSNEIPSPVEVRMSKMEDVAASDYSEEPEPDAVPAPLKIPVLRVARSSRHIQATNSNSFTPSRSGGFLRKISEASRLQQSKLGSHPALRECETTEVNGSQNLNSPNNDGCSSGPNPTTENVRIDSGIEMGSIESLDEGYATGAVSQYEFKTPPIARTSKRNTNDSTFGYFSQQWQGGSSSGDESGDAVRDVDVQALRNSVGLSPIRLASANESTKHPHHHFTWSHEKVMCRFVHNPVKLLPKMPQLPQNDRVDLSNVDSQYFNITSPTKSSINAKSCEICGAYCCRYANLVRNTKIKSHDLMEEMVRVKAQERVSALRCLHPNGIEEYETFLTCAQCDHKICPNCVKRCGESLCQAVVCDKCRGEPEVCPIHNFF